MTDALAATLAPSHFDPRNDPAYPMRNLAGTVGSGTGWKQPTLQPETIEVLQSVEFTRRPAVFGTATPPSGVSGSIRRLAFQKSESDWWHWLLLMAADRINVVEGLVSDLASGVVPNILAERGLKAELKHNRQAFIVKTTTTIAVTAVAVALIWQWRAGRNQHRR